MNKKWIEGRVDLRSEKLYRNYHQPHSMSHQSGIDIQLTRTCYMTDIDFVEYGFINNEPVPLFLKDIIRSREDDDHQSIYEDKMDQHSTQIYKYFAKASHCYFIIVQVIDDGLEIPKAFYVGNGLRKQPGKMYSVTEYTEFLLRMRKKCMEDRNANS